ncbi:unnamed protein product [Caenorhabditis angaria]|uniref:Uncharacterized protein n=1 Tax=Caenorhabditis angaria TaxID=860376 RepID=A0A9P1NA46_9PELO|nr:unnamed protein product [Caenorhabditis angaria]
MSRSERYAEFLQHNVNNRFSFTDREKIMYLESYMDVIMIDTNDTKTKHHAGYQLSLSLVEGDSDTKIDITFNHPNLPNGEMSYFEVLYSAERVEEIALQLQFAEMRNPEFEIDRSLRICVTIEKDPV